MAYIEFGDLLDCGNRFDIMVVQSMAGVDLQRRSGCMLNSPDNFFELNADLLRVAAVCIVPGMDLDHIGARISRRVYLDRVRVNEQGHPGAG